MDHDQETSPLIIPLAELRSRASALAVQLRQSPTGSGGTAQGSAHRGLSPDVRQSVIDLRTALFQRGIHDPVLERFDSATVAQASNEEIASQLDAVAAAL